MACAGLEEVLGAKEIVKEAPDSALKTSETDKLDRAGG